MDYWQYHKLQTMIWSYSSSSPYEKFLFSVYSPKARWLFPNLKNAIIQMKFVLLYH
jgi:hypothetical protein